MHKLPIDASLLGLHVAGDIGPLTIYRTKRGKTVAFPKSPPCKPPSPAQQVQRHRFRMAVYFWHLLAFPEQAAYDLVCSRLDFCLSGFNLWIHFCLSPDDGVFVTLQRQARVELRQYPHL